MTRRPAIVALLTLSLVLTGRLTGARPQSVPPGTPAAAAEDAPPPSYDTPPAITRVDGTARLVRQGQARAAEASMPLLERDRIMTEAGRVAITYPDGSLVHIDRNTTVDMLALDRLRVPDGRVILVAAGRGGEPLAAAWQIDAPAGSVRVATAGVYRVSAFSGATGLPQVEVAVVTGSASLVTDAGQVEVDAGERSWATDNAVPSTPETFNSARLDAFDQWSEAQRDASVATGASSQYLPGDLSAYGATFDRDGRWQYEEPYGYVWYPRVSVEWRPYYNGYWDYVGPYGWTWIGYDPWAWPTHHFGRWGVRAGLWFWMPTRFWGPAWVSWGLGIDYVGWCPLDFYNRPIVNIFAGDRYAYRGGHLDAWRCWTVVPRRTFGTGFRVAHDAVSSTRVPQVLGTGNFARRRSLDPPMAVPRVSGFGSDPATARAIPRALAPTASAAGYGATPRGSGFRAVTPGSSSSVSRPGASPRPAGPGSSGRTVPGWTPRSFENRPPMGQPRGFVDTRPPASGRAPQSPGGGSGTAGSRPRATEGGLSASRPGTSSPAVPRYQPPSRTPSTPAPRYDAPSRPPSSAVPRYQPPSRTPSTPAPRYDAPSRPPSSAVPRYQPPSRVPSTPAPRYDAPSRLPSSSMPRYQPPSRVPSTPAPRYDAPSRLPSSAMPRYQPPSRVPSTPAPRYDAPSRLPSSAMPRFQPSSPMSPVPAPRFQPPQASRPSGPPPSGARPRSDAGRGRGGK